MEPAVLADRNGVGSQVALGGRRRDHADLSRGARRDVFTVLLHDPELDGRQDPADGTGPAATLEDVAGVLDGHRPECLGLPVRLEDGHPEPVLEPQAEEPRGVARCRRTRPGPGPAWRRRGGPRAASGAWWD